MSRRPSVSAIVVTLGDDPRLPSSLEALAAAARDEIPLETIVVQNGVDGEGPPLPLPAVRRLRRAGNPGFAAAFDDAFALAGGEFVLSLNADARLEADGLRAAVAELDADPALAAIAFRLERPDGITLDSAGVRLGIVRRARDRGMGAKKAGRFPAPAEVDAACMACALFRRSALLAARDARGEVLDRRFFAYKEDVDLGWRLRRAGYRIRYLPAARAVHERGWREGGRRRVPLWIRRLSYRNRWLLIAKNESAWGFVARLALYVLVEVLAVTYLLLREPRVLAAYGAILRELPESIRRRPLSGPASR